MPRLYVTKGVELRQITGVGCAVPLPPSPSEIVANNSDRRSPSSPARTKDRVGIDGIAHGRSPETVTLRWGERFDLKGTTMKFLTHAQTAELLANEAASARGEGHDPRPIVELFAPISNTTR